MRKQVMCVPMLAASAPARMETIAAANPIAVAVAITVFATVAIVVMVVAIEVESALTALPE